MYIRIIYNPCTRILHTNKIHAASNVVQICIETRKDISLVVWATQRGADFARIRLGALINAIERN